MNTSDKSDGVPAGVILVAISLVSFSLLNIIVLSAGFETDSTKLLQRGVRFFLTCVLAFFLIRGAPFARWFTVVVSALSVVGSLLGFAALPDDAPALFRVWLLTLGVFSMIVVMALLTPSSITRHFSR